MGYFRVVEQKKRNKRIYNQTKNSCCAGVYYDDKKERYIKYSPNLNPGLTKILRRKSNKKIRQSKDVWNYNQYRKLYDYWCVLF